MDFCCVNPYIRFAETIHFESEGYLTFVRDCRIFYILSGEAEILINSQIHTLKPHTIFYCRGGCQYSMRSSGVELVALNFDLTQENNSDDIPYSPIRITQECNLPSYTYTHIDEFDFLNSYLVLNDCLVYHDQFDAILEEFATQRVLYRETCSGLLKSILSRLYRHSIASTTQSTNAVLNIIAYINSNYFKPLSNKQFSEMTGYHEYHLNRLFTKHFGFTIHQYILNVRIIQAKKMLLGTDLPLSAIADKIGYNSSTHFSRYFKQVVKMTPIEYRNRFKDTV